MTDRSTLTEQPASDGVDDPAPPEGAGGPTSDGQIEGQAAWPWLKDAALLLFVVFFGSSYLVIRSVGLDDVAGGSGAGGAASGPIEVSLNEFSIDGELSAAAGAVTLHIVNDGSVDHNLVVSGLGSRTANLAPGEEVTLELGDLGSDTYGVFCSLPGHRESGMEAQLVVES